MIRIIQRYTRLGNRHDHKAPIAIFKDDTGKVKFITALEIESTLRAAAASTYDLDPVKDKALLQLFSSHSYHVGACVLLHAMGYSPTAIKFPLRWESDAFMTYLRNLTILSNEHVKSFNEACNTMPLFL